ncbi:MAG: hypothetical protein SGI71_10470 [Verrucomicrobiota bacterium]|nr:hypothetical protein [Verrucomicrobiota bacterium]
MIRTNCRVQFSKEDINFIVETLSKTPEDVFRINSLIGDEQTFNSVLDHPALLARILDSSDQVNISSHLYFYLLTRKVIVSSGITDYDVSDYLASMLSEFSSNARLTTVPEMIEASFSYISDMLILLRQANPQQALVLQAHIGNYSLFMTGLFLERIEYRNRFRGAPSVSFYEGMGTSHYRAVSAHPLAGQMELQSVFRCLSDNFRNVRLALNIMSDRFLTLGEPPPPVLFGAS